MSPCSRAEKGRAEENDECAIPLAVGNLATAGRARNPTAPKSHTINLANRGMSRIFQKVYEDEECGNFSRVVDVARASLVFEKINQVLFALLTMWDMHKNGEIRLERIKPRVAWEKRRIVEMGGYRDVLINFSMPRAKNPELREHICEIQLHLKEFLEYKGHNGHATYE